MTQWLRAYAVLAEDLSGLPALTSDSSQLTYNPRDLTISSGNYIHMPIFYRDTHN